MLSDATIAQITQRGVKEIISLEEFTELLKSGRSLRLKMGFDPSRPDIHLGHVVGLRKLRQLQELGHQVILIVGDWTAQIGDPSGQSATRTMLTHEEVTANAESYLRQFFKVVDQQRAQVMWQSEWFGKFTLADVIRLTSRFTVAQFLERDDFAKRFQEHRPIAITELLYPLLQAYDSVMIESDVEFGGTDQMFNLLVGRELQGMMGQKRQQCFLMPILVGTDGVQKMSKSLDNYVGVEEPPDDMFGKLMSIPDEQVIPYFEYLTDAPQEQLDELARDLTSQTTNPMDAKKDLANQITADFHGQRAANAARDNFERVVQGRDLPKDIPEFPLEQLKKDNPLNYGVLRLDRLLVLTGLASSNSEAKRFVNQGAVEQIKASGETNILSFDSFAMGIIEAGDVLKAGKRRYARFIV